MSFWPPMEVGSGTDDAVVDASTSLGDDAIELGEGIEEAIGDGFIDERP